jgi:hypothetical protein
MATKSRVIKWRDGSDKSSAITRIGIRRIQTARQAVARIVFGTAASQRRERYVCRPNAARFPSLGLRFLHNGHDS